MSTLTNPIPLARRLVGQYLVFGLAGLFLCLAACLILSYRQQLDSNLWFIVLGTLSFLTAGALSVHQTARLSTSIERQLQAVKDASSAEGLPLERLPGNDSTAAGWNQLIELLAEQDAWRRIEERLANSVAEASQGQFEFLFRELPVAVAVTDEDDTIQETNAAFDCIAAGFAPDAAPQQKSCGKLLSEVLQFGAAFNSDEFLHRLDEYRGAFTFDLRRGEKSDDGVWCLTRSPLSGDGSDGMGFIWILREVTQQLMAEEMRNQFVATATHELRTPLTNIKAYAEMLDIEKGVSVEQQKEFCNIINAEATRLGRFIDDLLSINQMEVGSLSLHKHSTDLAAVVESVIAHAQPEFDKKQIAFESKLPAKWPKLMVDKAKIESALVNLVGNAAKYTPEAGRVSLEVEIDESHVRIHVEDTGIGISAEELPRVFDKFYRSEDYRVRELTGNGLGLPFSNEVARLHGGRLTVHSELNKGSRFTLVLPVT